MEVKESLDSGSHVASSGYKGLLGSWSLPTPNPSHKVNSFIIISCQDFLAHHQRTKSNEVNKPWVKTSKSCLSQVFITVNGMLTNATIYFRPEFHVSTDLLMNITEYI